MTPFWEDSWLQVWQGDCRAVMAEMPAESVHCVVTSPPYWGLRDYGTASWEGGDEDCDHLAGALASDKSTLAGYTSENIKLRTNGMPYRQVCGKCGARRIDNQLGLEPTPEEYVANMVAVFREVRRVLRADGTVWLNLGDSYAAGGPAGGAGKQHTNVGSIGIPARPAPPGLKPKDLVGIPWRVAFALQADGWYLRSDIIWSKPNPMPESVTDRPTKSHEYLFLLSKSPRYYFDADAVREAPSESTLRIHSSPAVQARAGTWKAEANGDRNDGDSASLINGTGRDLSGRNLRSVWTIATAPYPGAHFAVYPRKLVEPCIKAGTSERGVCPECGAPWVRVVERTKGLEVVAPKLSRLAETGVSTNGTGGSTLGIGGGAHGGAWAEKGTRSETTGWRPSCAHDLPAVPATVLDCFAGSGTTALVAQSLGRRAVLIDLSTDYLDQIMRRNAQMPLGAA